LILDGHQPLPGAIFEIVKVDTWGHRDPNSEIINNGKVFELKDKQMLAIHFTDEAYKEYYNSDAEKVTFLNLKYFCTYFYFTVLWMCW
jgi:transglutaminase/protease-like cytokinesis protein 3